MFNSVIAGLLVTSMISSNPNTQSKINYSVVDLKEPLPTVIHLVDEELNYINDFSIINGSIIFSEQITGQKVYPIEKSVPFENIKPSDWFYEAVISNYMNKLIPAEKTFKFSEFVTVEYMVNLLCNLHDIPLDLDDSAKLELLQYKTKYPFTNELLLSRNVTREEAVNMLNHILPTFNVKIEKVYSDTKSDVVNKFGTLGITANKDQFYPKSHITRAEVSQIVYNTINVKNKYLKEGVV